MKRWLVVVAFAVAMAWVESASVYYIRTLTDRIVPYQADPLPIRGVLGQVELVREAATLVMLLTVGMLAAGTWRKRLGYTAIAFGVWDIMYYVFLRLMCGWPNSLLDWDILFLLPLPWWGPVLAPVSIACLMIVWGTLTTQSTDRGPATPLTWATWGLSAIGIALALAVFMADSLRAAPHGVDVVRQVLPIAFNWTAFVVAVALMSAPLAQIGWRLISRNGRSLIDVDGPSDSLRRERSLSQREILNAGGTAAKERLPIGRR